MNKNLWIVLFLTATIPISAQRFIPENGQIFLGMLRRPPLTFERTPFTRDTIAFNSSSGQGFSIGWNKPYAFNKRWGMVIGIRANSYSHQVGIVRRDFTSAVPRYIASSISVNSMLCHVPVALKNSFLTSQSFSIVGNIGVDINVRPPFFFISEFIGNDNPLYRVRLVDFTGFRFGVGATAGLDFKYKGWKRGDWSLLAQYSLTGMRQPNEAEISIDYENLKRKTSFSGNSSYLLLGIGFTPKVKDALLRNIEAATDAKDTPSSYWTLGIRYGAQLNRPMLSTDFVPDSVVKESNRWSFEKTYMAEAAYAHQRWKGKFILGYHDLVHAFKVEINPLVSIDSLRFPNQVINIVDYKNLFASFQVQHSLYRKTRFQTGVLLGVNYNQIRYGGIETADQRESKRGQLPFFGPVYMQTFLNPVKKTRHHVNVSAGGFLEYYMGKRSIWSLEANYRFSQLLLSKGKREYYGRNGEVYTSTFERRFGGPSISIGYAYILLKKE